MDDPGSQQNGLPSALTSGRKPDLFSKVLDDRVKVINNDHGQSMLGQRLLDADVWQCFVSGCNDYAMGIGCNAGKGSLLDKLSLGITENTIRDTHIFGKKLEGLLRRFVMFDLVLSISNCAAGGSSL